MIWTALSAAGGFLRRVPWPVYAIAGALLAAWLWGNHRFDQGYAKRDAEYAAAAAQAVAQARKADGVALGTAEAGKALSEAEIERGRDAAEGADDPWGAAVDAMKGARP